MRASQLGALIKYTSRLEGNNIVSNRTNLIRTSNKLQFGHDTLPPNILHKAEV